MVPGAGPNVNKTWVMFKEPRNFTAAQAMCKSLNGDLVSITSREEHERYYQAFAGVNRRVWVGLRTQQPSTNPADWRWISTGQSPGFDEVYDGWAADQPSIGFPEPSMCAAVWLEGGGGFSASRCNTELPYACEIGGWRQL